MTGSVARDPGRQPERTRLSWRRTALGVTVVALLAARLAVHESATPARLLAVVAVLAGWLAVLVASWRRIMAMNAAEPGPVRAPVPVIALVALGYAGLGVALLAAP